MPIFVLIFMIPAGIAAQSAAGATPHVTDIQVESRNNLIRLSWVDSPDARGQVFIFRSARPFTGTVPANIRPVAVRYGQQYYVDDTDDLDNIHYFVAVSDTSGRRYDIILPRINSISTNFAQTESVTPPISETVTAREPALPANQTERSPVQGISNLTAIQDRERVIITFDTSARQRNAILYRSMQSLTKPQDLLNAVIVRSGVISPFIDSPVPGVSWYYAVIYEDEISSGHMGIRPGVNTTAVPVKITAPETYERTLRPIPLPVLTLRNTMPEGFLTEIPEKTPLSSESVRMLRGTQMPPKLPIVYKSPRVFAVDLESPSGGEESALFQIITEHFVKFDWENASVGLQHYLSLPRSREIEARARFYLGQALYYSQKYREALMQFLSFRNHHPAEANSWIDAVLTAMVY